VVVLDLFSSRGLRVIWRFGGAEAAKKVACKVQMKRMFTFRSSTILVFLVFRVITHAMLLF
jgi:hypothetical protein